MQWHDGSDTYLVIGLDNPSVASAAAVMILRNGRVYYTGAKAGAPFHNVRNETQALSAERSRRIRRSAGSLPILAMTIL